MTLSMNCNSTVMYLYNPNQARTHVEESWNILLLKRCQIILQKKLPLQLRGMSSKHVTPYIRGSFPTRNIRVTK